MHLGCLLRHDGSVLIWGSQVWGRREVVTDVSPQLMDVHPIVVFQTVLNDGMWVSWKMLREGKWMLQKMIFERKWKVQKLLRDDTLVS